jgi:PAS domain S-box-containing protein
MKSSKKGTDIKIDTYVKKKIPKADTDLFCNDLNDNSSKSWELDIAKTKLNKILNSSLDVICAVDANGFFLYVSAACESVWGYTADELIGKSLLDFVYPEDHEKTKAEAAKVMEGNNRIHFENRYVRKDGSLAPITWSARWDEKDKIRYGVARDATEKKKREESEYIYKSLFTNSPFPIYLWDIETSQLIDCNEETLLKYNYSREEFLQLNIHDLSTTKDLKIIDELIKTERDGKIHAKTWTHKRKNGELMHIDVCGHLINYNGREAFLVMVNDVTRRIESEELKEFDKVNTEALINSTEDLIWSVSAGFRLIVANKAFIKGIEDMTGITLKPGDDLLMTRIFQEEQLVFWKECYSNALQGKPVKKEVYTKATKNWNESWADISFNPIYKDQTVVGVACYSKNITKRKLAEEQLRKSEARLIEAQGVAKVGSWETDLLTLEVIWSQETYRIFEVDPDLFQPSHPNFIKYVHPDEREKVDAAFADSFYNNEVNTIEHRIITPCGLEKTVEESWRIFRDADGHPVRAMGTCQDITERKKSELKLKESNERYNLISQATKDMVWDWDILTGEVYRNKEGWRKILGECENGIENGTIQDWDKRIHPEDAEKVNLAIQEIQEAKKDIFEVECRIQRYNGTYAYIHDRGNIIRDEKGNAVRILGATQDITERKEAEIKVAKSEIRFKSLVQNSSDIVSILNDRAYYTYCSPAIKKILGYEPDDIIGKNAFSFIHPDDVIKIKYFLSNRHVTENLELKPYRYKNAQGEWRWLESKISDMSVSPEVQGYVFNSRDVTDRKIAEEEIEKLSIIARETVNAVIITDPEEKIIWVNEAFTKITEFEPADVIGKRPGDFLQGSETNQAVVRFMRQKIKNVEPFECDILNYSKSGGKYWLRIQCQPQYDTAGNLKYFFAIETDITKEKEAEQILKASEERYRYLFDNNPSGIIIWNPDDLRILEVNESCQKMYGYSRGEFLNLNLLDLRPPEEHHKIKELARQLQSDITLKPVGLWKHIDSTGKLMYMHIASHQIYYQGRKVIMAIFNNVTEKKLLEEELERQKTLKQHEITEAVISAQEQERQEIGRELHDNINQILASSRLYLSMVKKEAAKDISFLEETDNLINTAISEIRNLSHSMIPPSLNESELLEALRHLIYKTSRPSGIVFNLVSENFKETNISDKHKLTIYRIVQEQFSNILKYASAANVIVELEQDNEKILLSIKDDGVGFDTKNKSKGVGLMNIKTRASLFNGELTIVSAPGNGCELRVIFK